MNTTLVLVMIFATSFSVSRASVIYVDKDASPGGNGQRWKSAFDDLQDALQVAQDGDEIWIAKGIYYPTDTGNRTVSFILRDGVALYGGFAGAEDQREQRDWTLHETILSGNIGDPDNDLDNTYSIVTADSLGSSTVLDGLTITEAHNDCGCPNNRGGGIFSLNSDLTISNCSIVENFAGGGAGIWNDGGKPTLTDCEFRSNYHNGFTNRNGGLPRFLRCVFAKNRANQGGGYNGSVFVQHPVFVQCVFKRNKVKNRGGGFYGWGNAHLENCIFVKNKSGSFGGAVYVRGGDPTVTNCSFVGNSSDSEYGGLAIFSPNSIVSVTNTIFWGNTARLGDTQNQQIGFRPLPINYSCVEGWTGEFGGEGNHGEDPLFVDVKKDNYRLRAGSPSIDTGNNEVVTQEKDLDGNPRILHKTVDMGSYESVCDELRSLKIRCSDKGKLTAVVKTRLPQGSTVTLTNSSAKPKAVTTNKKGKAKTKWKNQTGPRTICPAGCDAPCKQIECP